MDDAGLTELLLDYLLLDEDGLRHVAGVYILEQVVVLLQFGDEPQLQKRAVQQNSQHTKYNGQCPIHA